MGFVPIGTTALSEQSYGESNFHNRLLEFGPIHVSKERGFGLLSHLVRFVLSRISCRLGLRAESIIQLRPSRNESMKMTTWVRNGSGIILESLNAHLLSRG